MKTAIFIITLMVLLTSAIFAGDNGSSLTGINELNEITLSNEFQATYEKPLDIEKDNINVIVLDSEPDRLKPDDNTIYLTSDSLKSLNISLGRFLLENRGMFVTMKSDINDNNIKEIISNRSEWKEQHKSEIKAIAEKWKNIKIQQQSNKDYITYDVSNTQEQIAVNKLLAGGSGSLDRQAVITFIFVDGNGPSNYDWTGERLDYSLDQIEIMRALIANEAERHGIKLILRSLYSVININYEPFYETSGIEFAPYVTIDGLDPWRSATIGNMGFDPNLEGLYDFNIERCGSKGAAEGAICFVVNFDTSMTNTSGQYADWACGWIPDYLVNKPFCTVSFNTQDSLVLMEKMMHECLHLFGAADEYYFSSACLDTDDCDDLYGKLRKPNGNCGFCTDEQEECIMRGVDYDRICDYSAEHLGWVDSDWNGGSDVDDIPVDYTALVTRNFKIGDIFSVYTLDGDFINAFIVSNHNSYAQPNGQRTVQVLGMNYDRVKISPGIYLGTINTGSPFTFSLDLDNNHPTATISNFSSYGPFLEFTVNGVAHFNMDIINGYEWDFLRLYAGDLVAGSNTVYRIGWQWLKDGDYPNVNEGWVCDGVNSPEQVGQHTVAYGPPARWPFDSVGINHTTNQVTATNWTPLLWTKDAYLMEYITALDSVQQVTDLSGIFGGWCSAVSWYHPTGSDSMDVYIEAVNPNGTTCSDRLSYITKPKTPRNVAFDQVHQTVCFPIISNDFHLDPNDKFPPECEPYTQLINAIAYEGLQPDSQRILNMTGFELRYGCYVEIAPNTWDYEWDSLYIPYQWGFCKDTVYDLLPSRPYSINARTVDKFGGRSPWALTNYASILVGSYPMNEPDAPGSPTDVMSKPALPEVFSLSQNYPNPFNPRTAFTLSLPVESHVSLAIYNILGQKIAVLADDLYPAGRHEVVWDGIASDGNSAGSGIYFARLQAGDFSETKKIVMMK